MGMRSILKYINQQERKSWVVIVSVDRASSLLGRRRLVVIDQVHEVFLFMVEFRPFVHRSSVGSGEFAVSWRGWGRSAMTTRHLAASGLVEAGADLRDHAARAHEGALDARAQLRDRQGLAGLALGDALGRRGRRRVVRWAHRWVSTSPTAASRDRSPAASAHASALASSASSWHEDPLVGIVGR